MNRVVKYSIFVIAGIMFCWMGFQSISVTLNGVRGTAICTRITRTTGTSSGSGRTTYHLKFTDTSGAEHLSKIKGGAFWLNPDEGESVPIIYNPSRPQTVFYDSWFHVWMMPAIVISVLGFILISGKIRSAFKES